MFKHLLDEIDGGKRKSYIERIGDSWEIWWWGKMDL